MNENRQVRSYHGAFNYELTIYRIGDIKPWWPIPARLIGWVAAVELATIFAVHALGLNIPLFTTAWGGVYLAFPFGLGYLFTVSKIEGRRLHVALRGWLRYILRGRRLVGGHRRLDVPKGIRLSRIRVRHGGWGR